MHPAPSPSSAFPSAASDGDFGDSALPACSVAAAILDRLAHARVGTGVPRTRTNPWPLRHSHCLTTRAIVPPSLGTAVVVVALYSSSIDSSIILVLSLSTLGFPARFFARRFSSRQLAHTRRRSPHPPAAPVPSASTTSSRGPAARHSRTAPIRHKTSAGPRSFVTSFDPKLDTTSIGDFLLRLRLPGLRVPRPRQSPSVASPLFPSLFFPVIARRSPAELHMKLWECHLATL